jgi:cobalt/nickel transport system permease protein
MHIAEGFLPLEWCVLWYAIAAPIVAYGIYRAKKLREKGQGVMPLLAVTAAFIFVLSALKLPSVTGSCSHPTGTGLGVVLFGPSITAFLSIIVLLFQALLLAHGGVTTLGANTVSMGIIGPLVGWLAYITVRRMKTGLLISGFVAAFFADLVTYVVTAGQLAAAFPATKGGILLSFEAFFGIFAVTQVPLAIVEGITVALVLRLLQEHGVAVEMWQPKEVSGSEA